MVYSSLLSSLLILVDDYSRNKNKMERTTDFREYLAIFLCLNYFFYLHFKNDHAIWVKSSKINMAKYSLKSVAPSILYLILHSYNK